MEVRPIAALAIPMNKRLCRMQRRHRPLPHPLTSDGGTVSRKCDPKQSLMHQSTLDQISAEKKELTMKMEKVISEMGEKLGSVLWKRCSPHRKSTESTSEQIRWTNIYFGKDQYRW
mmetsp:Transcript_14629/g.26491  ORF Transcript_14629/g.26491 Transcript_14629/m.26491 type:complete len:116 (-) Transcript_14629:255-602(-)